MTSEGIFMLCTVAVLAYSLVLVFKIAFGDEDD